MATPRRSSRKRTAPASGNNSNEQTSNNSGPTKKKAATRGRGTTEETATAKAPPPAKAAAKATSSKRQPKPPPLSAIPVLGAAMRPNPVPSSSDEVPDKEYEALEKKYLIKRVYEKDEARTPGNIGLRRLTRPAVLDSNDPEYKLLRKQIMDHKRKRLDYKPHVYSLLKLFKRYEENNDNLIWLFIRSTTPRYAAANQRRNDEVQEEPIVIEDRHTEVIDIEQMVTLIINDEDVVLSIEPLELAPVPDAVPSAATAATATATATTAAGMEESCEASDDVLAGEGSPTAAGAPGTPAALQEDVHTAAANNSPMAIVADGEVPTITAALPPESASAATGGSLGCGGGIAFGMEEAGTSNNVSDGILGGEGVPVATGGLATHGGDTPTLSATLDAPTASVADEEAPTVTALPPDSAGEVAQMRPQSTSLGDDNSDDGGGGKIGATRDLQKGVGESQEGETLSPQANLVPDLLGGLDANQLQSLPPPARDHMALERDSRGHQQENDALVESSNGDLPRAVGRELVVPAQQRHAPNDSDEEEPDEEEPESWRQLCLRELREEQEGDPSGDEDLTDHQRIEKWQEHTDNLFLDYFGRDFVKELEITLGEDRWVYEQSGPDVTHKFVLRGDSVYTMACILEEYALGMLRASLQIASLYEEVVVKRADFEMARKLEQTKDYEYSTTIIAMKADDWDSNLRRDKRRKRMYWYMRKLAYKAGIPKIDRLVKDNMFNLFRRAFQLTHPACLELVSRQTPPPSSSTGTKTALMDGETMRTRSPHPQPDPRAINVWTHIIVPGQIEAAAERYGFPCPKVYHGNGWFATTDDGEDLERENALNMYSSPLKAEPGEGERVQMGAAVDFDDVSMWDAESEAEEEEEEDIGGTSAQQPGNQDNEESGSSAPNVTKKAIDIVPLRKLQAYLDCHGRKWVLKAKNRAIVQKCLGRGINIEDCLTMLDRGALAPDDDLDLEREDYEWEELQQPAWGPRVFWNEMENSFLFLDDGIPSARALQLAQDGTRLVRPPPFDPEDEVYYDSADND